MNKFSVVPDSLTELDQWVLWRYITRDGKTTKVPYAATGRAASSTDPATWCSFERAIEAFDDGNYAGIGFVFSSTDPYIGIDLDKCYLDGALRPWAREIIERFADTYAEISPSGEGIKVFAKGKLPVQSGKKWNFDDGGIEIYDHARFFTVTANTATGAPSEVEEHQAEVDWLYDTLTATAGAKPRANLRTTEKVSPGARHNFLMSVAGQYRTRGMERTEILAALRAINTERCEPPKPDHEIVKIVDWVGEKPAGTRPRAAVPQPITTAAVPATALANWRDHLILTSNGQVKTILANAITALRHAPQWAGLLGFNDFTLDVSTTRETPWNVRPVQWTDHEDRLTAEWLQREGVFVSTMLAAEAVQAVARDRSFHPVREYLAGLQWDGEPRIDHWLSEYLGAENDEYSRAVGARWLIQCVARIYQPGCKADSCLILEGEQGIRKSTALKTISQPWFTDEIADLGSKDAALQTRGVWVIEIAELDSMSRGDVGRIKAFMSRGEDRFRPPFGKRTISSPRQCVFAGSVNHSSYLRDETGARRFWPVACTVIDIPRLESDRDQIWSEAVARYQDGAAWWIDERGIQVAAEEQQAARYEGDPWDEPIQRWLADVDDTTVGDILTHCIGKEQKFWTQPDRNRVARVLRTSGWVKYRSGQRSTREWRYRLESSVS
jgi:predicted P-loop ATPase